MSNATPGRTNANASTTFLQAVSVVCGLALARACWRTGIYCQRPLEDYTDRVEEVFDEHCSPMWSRYGPWGRSFIQNFRALTLLSCCAHVRSDPP